MKYVGKHKINGKEIYKFNNKHYYLKGENFIKMEELTNEEKQMLKILHEHGTEIKYSKQTEQLNIPVVSGSCFWGHKWTKWVQYTQQIRTKFGDGNEIRQKRYCVRCGKMQDEWVS